MKTLLLLVLLTTPSLIFSAVNDDMTCKEKEDDIKKRIKKAQDRGNTKTIRELQANLARVQNNCDDSDLIRKRKNDIKDAQEELQEAKDELSKANFKLSEAKKKGDTKAIKRREKRVQEAEEDLKEAQDDLAAAKKKVS